MKSKKLILLISLFLLLFSGCSSVAIVDSRSLGEAFSDIIVKIIDFGHYKIHVGEHYYVRDYFTLGNGATLNIVIYTGEREAHLLPTITGNNGAINVSLYENPTITTNGTEIIYYNSNYNYGDLNGLTLYSGSTISNLGDFKGRSYVGDGRTFGGIIRAENEIILQANSTYLFQITNQITTNNIVDVVLNWYEDN